MVDMSQPPQPLQEEILFSSSEAGLDANLVANNFNFIQLRDLWVRVKLREVGKPTRVVLTFTSPYGEEFYQASSLYSNDPNLTEMPLAGMDHKATVYRAKPIAGGYALDTAIPIGGSIFTRYPRPGMWQIKATAGTIILNNTITVGM